MSAIDATQPLPSPVVDSIPPPAETTTPSEEKLPKLSAADFKVYNRTAEMMEYYHNHFRHIWNFLYGAASQGSRPSGVSIRSFISQGLQFCSMLTTHHGIEERYIFPELATRMDTFKPHDHLISQHEQIHEGLEKLETYLRACQSGERELRLDELKNVLDTFGKVLWEHLDDEVRMLGAQNMRKYWSKEEMLAMRW